MEAISKRTGQKFTGKVASLMIRIGVATSNEPKEDISSFDLKEDISSADAMTEKPKRVYKKKT